MKTFWATALITALLALTACSAGEGPEPNDDGKAAGQQDRKELKETGGPSAGEHEGIQEGKRGTSEKDGEGQEKKQERKKQQPKPKYRVTENYYIQPLGDADPRVVLLTIDDAPEEHAVEMAKTLKKLKAPAIFFVNGIFIDSEKGAEKLQKIHQMGFSIGNHTFHHIRLSTIPEKKQKQEIVSTYKRIRHIIGKPPAFFRAPNGDNTDVSEKLTDKHGTLVMNWSYGYDWQEEYMSEAAIADIMVNTPLLRNGAILLMHDRDWTAKALDDIVKGLRKKGYTILDPSLLKTPEDE